MFDPEGTDGFVWVGQGEAIRRFGMRKESWVEVEPQTESIGPGNPVPKMLRLDLVSIDAFAPKLAIGSMEIDPVGARDEGKGLFDIGAQFGRSAGFARVLPSDRNAAVQRRAGVLKPGHIIPLPTMERERDASENFQGAVNLDAEIGVALASVFERDRRISGSSRHNAEQSGEEHRARLQLWREDAQGSGIRVTIAPGPLAFAFTEVLIACAGKRKQPERQEGEGLEQEMQSM